MYILYYTTYIYIPLCSREEPHQWPLLPGSFMGQPLASNGPPIVVLLHHTSIMHDKGRPRPRLDSLAFIYMIAIPGPM